jgi:hypothetical protein
MIESGKTLDLRRASSGAFPYLLIDRRGRPDGWPTAGLASIVSQELVTAPRGVAFETPARYFTQEVSGLLTGNRRKISSPFSG